MLVRGLPGVGLPEINSFLSPTALPLDFVSTEWPNLVCLGPLKPRGLASLRPGNNARWEAGDLVPKYVRSGTSYFGTGTPGSRLRDRVCGAKRLVERALGSTPLEKMKEKKIGRRENLSCVLKSVEVSADLMSLKIIL